MLLQWLWMGLMAASLGYAALMGRGDAMLAAALEGTGEAIALTIRLGAGYLLFCGLMEVAKAAGAVQLMERLARPLLKRLMPRMRSAAGAVTLNLSLNLLGVGNAATPAGLEAMRLLDEEYKQDPLVRHDMHMLLILNATSLQLLPTTVLTLRAAAGSANPNAVLVPTLLCTALSTVVGAGLGKLLSKGGKRG